MYQQPPHDPNQPLPYPPLQQPYGQTPPKPPKRKEISARRAIFLYASILIGAVVLLIIGANLMYGAKSSTWNTVQSYAGSEPGAESFTTSSNWRISWQCTFQGTTASSSPFVVDATIDNSIHRLVHETCQSNQQSGVSDIITQTGTVSLVIAADPGSQWTITVEQQE